MPKIINVPIEPLEERYSAQWNRWIPEDLAKLNVPFIHLDFVEPLSDKISQGSFLDVVGTNYYKAGQARELMDLLDRKQIVDRDVILLNDIWFPGLEMLAYVRDALDIDFRIAGIAHAGTWDPHDFLSQKKMGYWAENLENSWFEIVDYVLVNSHFHKDLLLRTRQVSPEKMFVVGYPFRPEEFVDPMCKKENIVVFPHRLDPEKQPQVFDEIAKELQPIYPDWQFIKTKDVWTDKKAYYELLNRSKIAFSCALQETFGIAMVESVMCGCVPVVPDRLSYRCLYDQHFKYDSDMNMAANLMWHMDNADKTLFSSKEFYFQRKYLIDQTGLFTKRVVQITIDETYEDSEWLMHPSRGNNGQEIF